MTSRVTRRPPQSESPIPAPARAALQCWHDDVNRLFDGFFPAAFGGSSQPAIGRSLQGLDPWPGHALRGFGELVPSIDVKERTDRYEIVAEFAQGVLTITGPKHDDPVECDRKIEIKPH